MKVSSSRMKNKVGAQKGAFIKMKQENSHIYQRICVVCYAPIIAPFQRLSPSMKPYVFMRIQAVWASGEFSR